MACGFLCGVGFRGGYCLFSLLGFPPSGYGCWVRVEVGWWLLCGGFGAVLRAVAYSVGLGAVVTVGGVTIGVSFGFLCGGYCNPCGGCVCGRHSWVLVAVALRGG